MPAGLCHRVLMILSLLLPGSINLPLQYLTKAHFPKPEKYDTEGVLRLTIRPFTFSGLPDASFNQIRQYGAPSPSVMIRLMGLLCYLWFCFQKSDKDDILRHADMIFRTSQITFKKPTTFRSFKQV
ncbi:MAG: DUF2254 family protein [Bacteroidales bacterium]